MVCLNISIISYVSTTVLLDLGGGGYEYFCIKKCQKKEVQTSSVETGINYACVSLEMESELYAVAHVTRYMRIYITTMKINVFRLMVKYDTLHNRNKQEQIKSMCQQNNRKQTKKEIPADKEEE